mmetsp:Transcript_81535/g.264159  ORF Transcript_81535/g.264159 Transcript_81535/m.264159 type:complete len:212 (+) Transcript_81535:71-706(+)
MQAGRGARGGQVVRGPACGLSPVRALPGREHRGPQPGAEHGPRSRGGCRGCGQARSGPGDLGVRGTGLQLQPPAGHPTGGGGFGGGRARRDPAGARGRGGAPRRARHCRCRNRREPQHLAPARDGRRGLCGALRGRRELPETVAGGECPTRPAGVAPPPRTALRPCCGRCALPTARQGAALALGSRAVRQRPGCAERPVVPLRARCGPGCR